MSFDSSPKENHNEEPNDGSLVDRHCGHSHGLGLVMVYSASAVLAAENTGDEACYFSRQLISVVVGMSFVLPPPAPLSVS